jgi:hypothetical protein
MTKFDELYEELKEKIVESFENGVTLDEAEKLSFKFLYAQLMLSSELKKTALDARMRKSGVKSIRAAIYLDIVQKSDKKPTEAQITAMLDSDTIVAGEQQAYDEAEVAAEELERNHRTFENAHVLYRKIIGGRME